MKQLSDMQQRLAVDSASLNRLKSGAASDPKRALGEAARQFEAGFMGMLIKSMRDASPKSGLLSGNASETFGGMFDQEIAQRMASQGTGLAKMIERQLGRQLQGSDPAATAAKAGTASVAPTASNIAPGASKTTADDGTPLPPPRNAQESATVRQGGQADGAARHMPRPTKVAFENLSGLEGLGRRTAQARHAVFERSEPSLRGAEPLTSAEPVGIRQERFIGSLREDAQRVAAESGIPAKFMLGQAALETGWGRHQIRHSDGSPSYNLFGIKAGPNWKGKTVEVMTTEYVNGAPQKMLARFRAYESYEESFRDYAKLVGRSPRYASVGNNVHSAEAFAGSLQRAGYATDPSYASKLSRTINSVIAVSRAMHSRDQTNLA